MFSAIRYEREQLVDVNSERDLARGEVPCTRLQNPLSAAARLRDMAGGYRASQLVLLAVRLNVADHLADGPRSVDDLAAMTGTLSDPLYRVLRGMAGLGLLEETADGCFQSTELAQLLRRDHPHSVAPNVLFTASEENTRAWAELEQTLRTGISGFEHAFGMPRFSYLRAHPEWATVFQSQMTLQMQQVARAVVAAYDFSGAETVADIGGGHGHLLATVLQANPNLRGVLFDVPEVVSAAEDSLRRAGVLERCRLAGGDFFAAVPVDADLYLMSWILHDWPDDQALRILRTCRSCMRPGSRILLIERVLPERAEPTSPVRDALLGDLHMLAVLSGRERTQRELATLLNESGFSLERVFPTDSPRMILEAM